MGRSSQLEPTHDGGFAPDGACALHAPLHLNAVAVTNGFLPRSVDASFAWADLACGDGINAAVHAAANPGGAFFALGPAGRARAVNADASLDNLALIGGGLSGLADDALPPLDFAIFDGGLAGLAEAERMASLARLAALLKPGGILLLGYHALPGFAAMMPLRDVLHSLTAELAPAARLRTAREWVETADQAASGFLADHPAVRRRFAAYATLSDAAVAAELFGPHLKPFHFAQVETTARAQGLNFCGNAEPFLNMRDLALPPAVQSLVRGAKTRTAFETLRDLLRNPFYRRDVYVKGAPVAREEAFWTAHDDLVVGLVDGAPETVDFGGNPVTFSGFAFAALREGLADGPKRVGAIPGLIPELARDAVRAALAAGIVRPMPQAAPTPATPLADTVSVPHRFNRAVLGHALEFTGRVPLAAPLTGGFVTLSRAEAVALDAIAASGADAEAAIVRRLKALGQGDSAEADHACRAAAREGLDALTPERLAALARMGVIAA